MKLNDRKFVTMLMTVAVLFLNGAVASSYISAKQKPAQPKCPVTKVACPDSVNVKDKLKFTAQVSGGDANVTPTYNWTVSAGSIESGQGTSTVDVDTSEVAPDSTITATVELGGFGRDCGYGSTAASCTTIIAKKAEARKLDEYGKIMPKEEEPRLDNFVIELNMDPTAQGYIIAYSGRVSRPGDAQKAADRAKNYLVNKRALEGSRVVTVDGGSREQPAIELWIVPSGAEPPKPTPTVKRGDAKSKSG